MQELQAGKLDMNWKREEKEAKKGVMWRKQKQGTSSEENCMHPFSSA